MSYFDDINAAIAAEVAAGRLTGAENNQAVFDHLTQNTTERDREVIPAYEVIVALVPSEWSAISDIEKQRFAVLTGVGEVNVKSANVRAAFIAMFGPGTTTRSNLAALQTETITWAEFYGLAGLKIGHIIDARS